MHLSKLVYQSKLWTQILKPPHHVAPNSQQVAIQQFYIFITMMIQVCDFSADTFLFLGASLSLSSSLSPPLFSLHHRLFGQDEELL